MKKRVDFLYESVIITMLRVTSKKHKSNRMMRNGVIGSTADSDSVSRGSSPFSVAWESGIQIPYFIGVWLSLVERYVRDVEAAGSNPVTPIHPPFYGGFFIFHNVKAD